MNIQAPPNLSPGILGHLIAAGINDWGGVSPITPDYVNPERPWPHLDVLAKETSKAGKVLTERLAIYPAYVRSANKWVDPALRTLVTRAADAQGFARADAWVAGSVREPKPERPGASGTAHSTAYCRGSNGYETNGNRDFHLIYKPGRCLHQVCDAADTLRKSVCGDTVTYVVTRNINYTNICYFRCKFCAFSKGKLSENLRGRPYDLTPEEIHIVRRSLGSRCRRGVPPGRHSPAYTTASTYLSICRAIKAVCPQIHIHAFSPLEIWHGASTPAFRSRSFLAQLKEVGLGSLPGTAAEILDDEVRSVICPDKITTAQWLQVVEAAHNLGIKTTATIMFGHVDSYRHWARHLLRIRDLQTRTGGFYGICAATFRPNRNANSSKGPQPFGADV